MAEIIKKIANAGKIYSIGGGSTPAGEDNRMEYLTQEEYNALSPEQKADTSVNYVIIGEGESGSIDAKDVSFTAEMSTIISDNVHDAIEEVFTNVSNGKELLADAITDKGVETSADDTFQEMAEKIGSLSVTDMTQDQIARYNSSNGLVYFNGGSAGYRYGAYIITGQGLTVAYIITGTNYVSGILLRGNVVKTFSTNPDMRGNYTAPEMYSDGTMIYIKTGGPLNGCITINNSNDIGAGYVSGDSVFSQNVGVGSNAQESLGGLTVTCYKTSTSYYNMIVTGTK